MAPPPEGDQPSNVKGKTPSSNLTPAQIKKKKVEFLHLTLSFAFAAKHYLRGEDGVNWPDYIGILPKSFLRRDDLVYGTQRNSSPLNLASLKDGSIFNGGGDRSIGPSGTTTPEFSRSDPTKRIRAKRSKTRMGTDPSTPLLSEFHRSVNIQIYDDASMPLPLMYVPVIFNPVCGALD